MKEGYVIRDQKLPHFITATVIDWVDVFSRKTLVRSGIVSRPQDYIYSSASNYVDSKGILEVELVQIPVINVLNPSSILKYNSYD